MLPIEPKVSVIIPTCRRADLLKRCLSALDAQDYPRSGVEVIVVDDSGSGLSVPGFAVDPPVRFVYQKNRGPASARNTGARIASGDILVFLDDDCTPHVNWLSELVRGYASHPDAAGIAGSLEAGSEASAIGHWEVQEFMPLFDKLNAEFGTTFRTEGRVWFHFGCNCSYQREAFLSAGGYNESLRFMEDTDLQWRLRESGERVYYVPSAVVGHNCNRTLVSELRRCYRSAGAYRSFRLLHPGYAEVAAGAGRRQSFIKGFISGVLRAGGYPGTPVMRMYFVLIALIHKSMYAVGYACSRKSAIPQIEGDHAGLTRTGTVEGEL